MYTFELTSPKVCFHLGFLCRKRVLAYSRSGSFNFRLFSRFSWRLFEFVIVYKKKVYFEHGQCFISGILVFSFLVFSIFKYLLFLAIFPDLKMLQFWSVNYVCQVCKLYIYFEHGRHFQKYLY